MQDTEIYIKTDAGRDEIRSRTLGLPMSVRAILLMVDGQRPISAMRALIAGSKAPPDVLDTLIAQGLIAPRHRAGAEATAAITESAAAPRPAPPEPPINGAAVAPSMPAEATIAAAMRNLESGIAPSATGPSISYDDPLDLELPTIHGPDASDAAAPPTSAATAVELPAAGSLNPYEHLYAMMNEIVRDFLAPHRRYFFQLKIERCGTAEELLELLHGLQTALAKTRGDAFASDVIARLRSAAAG